MSRRLLEFREVLILDLAEERPLRRYVFRGLVRPIVWYRIEFFLSQLQLIPKAHQSTLSVNRACRLVAVDRFIGGVNLFGGSLLLFHRFGAVRDQDLGAVIVPRDKEPVGLDVDQLEAIALEAVDNIGFHLVRIKDRHTDNKLGYLKKAVGSLEAGVILDALVTLLQGFVVDLHAFDGLLVDRAVELSDI